MFDEKLIITGVPPTSSSGTGDFLLYLKNYQKFKIAWKPVSFSFLIKVVLISAYNLKLNSEIRQLSQSLILYLTKIYPLTKFKKKINQNFQNLYLFHPQSLSYEFSNKLAKLRVVKGIYILDNSYFCFASYNWLERDPYIACTKCIENKNSFISYGCKDIFGNATNEYIFFRENLYNGLFGKIYVQNHSHKKLFSLVSNGKKSTLVGMLPQSLLEKNNPCVITKKDSFINTFYNLKCKYKFVLICHMNFSGAKGYFLIKEVSKYLNDICFIFPFSNPKVVESNEIQENLIYLPCSWDKGLKTLCEESDMVLVPSIWTVQIEGALLKSCLFGKRIVSIAESIIDKRDYLEGIYYLSTTGGIEQLSKQILDILNVPPNQDLLKSSLKKYIHKTKKTWKSF